MAKYKADELTPILSVELGESPKGGTVPTAPPKDIEIWPIGKPPKKGKKGQRKDEKPIEVPSREHQTTGAGPPGEGTGKEPSERVTLTDTEKVIEESDATSRGVLKKIYEEAQRKARKMLGKPGVEAGASLNVFKPLIEAKINWSRLLKQKVRFFADKIGRKLQTKGSYLMYPWKAQSQVGIIAKGPLRQPKFGYIYMIFAFDTSGSITQDEMEAIITELNAVAQVFKRGKVDGKVFALEWDTQVHQFKEFKPSGEIKVYGGGGTDPESIFRFIDSKIIEERENTFLLKLTPNDLLTVRKLPGTKYTTAPFLVIFTDGQFSKMSISSLGKIYGMSENNILYILTMEEGKENIYPKDNYIIYDKPKF